MNKNYLKITAILIAIMTIYSIAIYIIAAKRNENKQETNKDKVTEPDKNSEADKNTNDEKKEEVISGDYNIIISPNTILSFKDGKWYENSNLKYNDKLFDVYVNNEYINKLYLSFSDGWYIFDSNKNFIDYEGKVLAINTSLEYRVVNYLTSELNINDQSNITSVLNDKGITTNYDELKKSKIVFDINKDGMRDEIYFVSNSFGEESSSNKAFSLGFVKYYDKTEIFYDVVNSVENIYEISNPYLQNIIEIDNETYIIVGSEYYSNEGTEHYIYKISNSTIKEVLKTSINNN